VTPARCWVVGTDAGMALQVSGPPCPLREKGHQFPRSIATDLCLHLDATPGAISVIESGIGDEEKGSERLKVVNEASKRVARSFRRGAAGAFTNRIAIQFRTVRLRSQTADVV
jgi:hypothetical protein